MGTQQLRLAVLIILFAVAMIGAHAADGYRMAQTVAPAWNSLPRELVGWSGTDGAFDSAYGLDPADTSFLRIYQRAETAPVVAYVGFYHNLATYMEFHTPEICYPAQGWTVLSSGRSVDVINSRGQFRPEQAVVEKNGQRRLVVWWYYAGARAFENRIRYAFAVLVLSSLGGRRDGSMVRLETPLDGNGDLESASKRLEAFERNFLPKLDEALPH